jgi:hypothetical protein
MPSTGSSSSPNKTKNAKPHARSGQTQSGNDGAVLDDAGSDQSAILDDAVPSLTLLNNVPTHLTIKHSNDKGDFEDIKPGHW